MNLTFLQPWGALLLLLLPLIWWLGRRSRMPMRLLRCGLFVCLAVALMQPVLLFATAAITEVIIVDQTDSLTASAKAQAVTRAQQLLAAQQANDKVHSEQYVLQLGGAAVDFSHSGIDAEHYLTLAAQQQSALSTAVAQALTLIPHQTAGHISVISDGLATDNQWQTVLAELKQRQIPLDWLTLPARASHPFIAKLTAPTVRMGAQQQLQLQLQGVADADTSLLLQVYAQTDPASNGAQSAQLLAQQTVAVDALNESSAVDITLPLVAAAQPFTSLQVNLSQAKNLLDQRQFTLAANPAISVLYVAANEAASNQARGKLQQLLGAGFAVQTTATLDDNTDFSQYQLVMLDDVAREQLPIAAQRNLQTAVEQGVGLLYSGAENAFGDGTLAQQPLAQLLPVQLSQTHEERQPGVSLAIVIDSSGSMKGQPMELAKQVARLAVKKLKPQDQVGIVEFYGTRQWAVPMQNVDNPKEIERAIGRMQAQGGSELFPAIQEAYFGLKSSQNRYRHILLITDAAVEEDNYQRLLRFIAQDQINVSAVMVGRSQGGEQRMAELANWGRGRFYAIPDEFSMVELNFHRPSNKPQNVYQRGEFVVQAVTADKANLPQPLLGFAHTQTKAAAKVLYREAKSADPLVSRWRIGAGNVTALMFSPLAASTDGWQQWPDYGKWLAQLARQTANSLAPLSISTVREQHKLFVEVQLNLRATDMSPTAATVDAAPKLQWQTVKGHSGNKPWQTAELVRRTPNIYTAEITVNDAEEVQLQSQYQQQLQRHVSAVATGAGLELTAPYQYRDSFRQVVQQAAGHIYADSQRPAAAPARASWQALNLYPLWLALGLLLYFIEIIVRRWPRSRRAAPAVGAQA